MRITVHVIQVHCRLQFVWLTTIQKRARNSLTQPKEEEEEEEAEREKRHRHTMTFLLNIKR